MPEVTAKFYLDTVKKLKEVPKFVKGENGTEHSIIEPLHMHLHTINDEAAVIESFSIIASIKNQRIELYWSVLQRDRIGWGKGFF